MTYQVLLCAILVLSGCAAGPERQMLRDAGPAVELVHVPFFAQDRYQCGPAALATLLVSDGIDVTPQQLVSQVYVPARRGSLQAELLAASRRHGRVPYVLAPSLAPVLEALTSGHPVLVLQNLRLERWPVWHYAVLIGFDADREAFLLRSGTTPRQRSSARSFLASWNRAGRWSLVVVPPDAPPPMADVLGWLQAVAPFESMGDLVTAETAYEAAVARWPESGLAWTALGNVRYLQQAFTGATHAYIHALTLSPELWIARNNLVRTMIANNCPEQAPTWLVTPGPAPVEMAATWRRTLEALADTPRGACRPEH